MLRRARRSPVRLAGDDKRLVQGDTFRIAATLLIVACARVVHEHTPHHARGDRQELRAVVRTRRLWD